MKNEIEILQAIYEPSDQIKAIDKKFEKRFVDLEGRFTGLENRVDSLERPSRQDGKEFR